VPALLSRQQPRASYGRRQQRQVDIQEAGMDTYLLEVDRNMDNYQSREEIMYVMDELEYLFDALQGEEQDICSRFLSTLEERLSRLPS
jgi:hypothetical protein